jgi:hypothetical protein
MLQVASHGCSLLGCVVEMTPCCFLNLAPAFEVTWC